MHEVFLIRTEEMEAPLMTASMRSAARVARYAKYNRAVIRFVFHDGVILQAIFHPQETRRCFS